MIVTESANRLSISETTRKHKEQEYLWAFQRGMTETKLASFYEIWYNDHWWGLKSQYGKELAGMEKVQSLAGKIIANVEKVIIGKHKEVQQTLLALLCHGHLLIEDVPGVGKTMLARVVAKSIGCTFRRIQFTPDMLPSDVTGVSVFNQKTREFEFRPGPVMAQIVLTDEINRATPKTQSALLEAMEERQITVDGVTYPMELPFLVMATQNPIEYEGTFPLPEAQLDRFMLRIHLGYPSQADEIAILDSQQYQHPIENVSQVISVEELVEAQNAVKEVYVDPLIKEYIVVLVKATREHPDIYLGASPRGSLAIYQTSRALAAVQDRDYVIPDDVKALVEPTLAHRLIVSPSARIKDVNPRTVVEEIVQSVPVPGARVKAQRRA
jgi:MoxR-like ATPase